MQSTSSSSSRGGKRVEQAEKISSLEAEVHDRDMTIMELKAKLYDLMTAGEN